MKLRSAIMVGASVVAFSAVGLMAEDAETVDTGVGTVEIKAGKEKSAAQELTLAGTLTKSSLAKKTTYVLTQEDGVIARLAPKAAEAAGINLDGYLKARVTLVGKGREVTHRGTKSIHIDEVIKIDKVEAAAETE